MLDRLLGIIAPHYCYGCQKSGYVLCPDCNYDISDESIDGCLVCLTPTLVGICSSCKTSYDKSWFVGDRSGALEAVIDAYKFKRVKAAAHTLAALLDARLPVLPADTVIVPVPTIRSHVRQRGYDHALLIARYFADLRQLKMKQLVERRSNGVQRNLNKRQRFKQAETSFICRQTVSQVPYLVVDDIVTTNATVRYVSKALRDAGAETVWVGVVARQELKKDK